MSSPPQQQHSLAARTLAQYATALRFAAVPPEVVRRAKDCLIDAIGAAVYGHEVPAGQAALRYSMNGTAAPGRCAILGSTWRVSAEAAAFANGVLTHAAELDSLRQPGSGVHPGAAIVPAALAAAQAVGASGSALLHALIAGIEVLFRIGNATRHSAEARGFHAPGLTGPFGAAVAAGCLHGLDADRLADAMGIAGSLGGGLLEFAKSGDGGLVKRIHLGRAAQAGVMAVGLARAGFDGPSSVLEGPYGFLNAYCAQADAGLLTDGLGLRYETLTLCIKRYACHIVAHTPVFAAQRLQAEHGIAAHDIEAIHIEGAARIAANHDIKAPGNSVLAQYSVPWCVALAWLHDADEPASFGPALLQDQAVHALAQRVHITRSEASGASALATTTHITLRNGATHSLTCQDFPGCPGEPLSRAQLRAKFMRMTRRLGEHAEPLFERLEHIEQEPNLYWLDAAAPAQPSAGAASS